jgi:hypothetical protein
VTIVSTSDDGLKSATDKANTNGLASCGISACISTLKNQNSITSNLELIIYNMASNFDTITTASEVRNNLSIAINVVNPTTGAIMDLSKCSSSPSTFSFPVPPETKLRDLQTSTTTTTFAIKPLKYNLLLPTGVDIYNPNNAAYTDRCTSVIDPNTAADTTINYRIQNYFQGVAIQCSSGCSYDSIDTKNNVKCICNGIPSSLHIFVVPTTIPLVSEFNLDLFNCSANAFGTTIGNNPAFWLSTALLILFVLLTPCMLYVNYFSECQVTNGYGEKLANSSHIQENNAEVIKRRRDPSEYEHSFCTLYWLRIKEDHVFLSVFAHKSLAYPLWMRFALLIFNLNIMFALSAFLFTDNLIYNRALIDDIDTRDAFFFPISNEMDRVALILVFTYIFVELFRFTLKRMPADLLVQMESASTGGDVNKAMDDVKSYNSRMKVKNLIVMFIMVCCHMVGWYYMIVFNAVYTTLAKGWAFGALNALILDYFGISLVIILIKTLILSCLRKS